MWSNSLTINAQSRTITLDPSDFTTHIDNPFLPAVPGTTYVYEDKEAHSIDYVVTTDKTKVIDGVTCVVVHDYEYVNGQLSEDTHDWLAQDSEGNVWYFGESSYQYEPGNPDPVGHEGSWKAGTHGSEPGIIMEANPQVGDVYAEENAAPIANDMAEVESLTESAHVVYGHFDGLLETRNFSPLEPDVTEHKWYAAGIGNVLTTDNEGAYEQLVQVIFNGKSTSDTLNGLIGRDTINGGGGDDTLAGLGGRDILYGGAGNDTATGGARNDTIDGGKGNDTVDGGSGDDIVKGGFGNDTLRGGHGADTFVFAENDGSATDTIVDYSETDGDTIALTGGVGAIGYDSHRGGWHIVLNDGHVIFLSGVEDADGNGHILDNISIVDALG